MEDNEGLHLPLESFLPNQSFISLQRPQPIAVTPLCSINQKAAEEFWIHKENGAWSDPSHTKSASVEKKDS